ncbi:MAG: MerR family transcriptional regulator [Candidatus Binatia bacterium]
MFFRDRPAGFPSASACRIVGITPRQVQYWDEIGLVKPSARPAAGRGTRRRYSFLDLVRLSVVRALIERGLTPRKIRRSLAALREASPRVLDPLAQLKLVTDGERLFLVTDDHRQILDVLDRQFAFSIALGPLVRRLRGRAARLKVPTATASQPASSARRGASRLAAGGWERRARA